MCGGGKTKTSTSSTGALPQYQQAYSSLLGQAQNTASTAWNPATGQQVAGFTAPQTQAFDATQANLGAYQPYLGQASSSLSNGNLTPESIQQFMSPYTQNVVDATQAQFNNQNAQAAQAANANAAKIGALTGDRSQVAQGILAGQQQLAQAPVIAGLYNQGYQTAAQTAGQAASLANQNAALASSIGGQAQQYGLNDISSLLGIGNLQQTQQQNVLNANTANAQAQAQYPFATQQWLASLATGLGGAAGSKSSQTQPGPNLWSQLLGGGLAAASLFNQGGRVGYASGGDVGLPYGDAPSYVPSSGIPHGGMNHQGPMPSMADNTQGGLSGMLSDYKQAKSAFQGMGNLGSRVSNWANTTTDPNSGWSTTTSPSGFSGWGNFLGNSFGFAEGGPVRGYADGGDVTDLVDDGSGVFSAPSSFDVGSALSKFLPAPVEHNRWATTVSPAPAPVQTASLPAPSGVGAMAAAPLNDNVPQAPMAVPYALPASKGLFGAELSEPARQGLLAAGLGIMASQSPWVGTAIGEGGLQGVQTYNKNRQQVIEGTQNKQKIDQEAQRLAQAAKQAAETLKLGYAQLASEAPLRAAQVANYQLSNQQTRAGMQALSSPDVLKPYLGTPFEAVARAAAAKGDVEGLANINKEMAQYGLLPMGTGLPASTAPGSTDQVPLDDYLKSIPDPLVRGQAGAVLRGETTLQNLTSRSPGIAAQVQRLVYNYDPTFDPQAAVRRNDWRMQMQKGPLQVQRQAIGTMFEHLNTAANLAQKLNPSALPVWNAAKNTWDTQTGDPNANNLAIALNNYATEYAKLIAGRPPSDSQVAEAAATLHNAMSGKQLSGGLATLQELAEGRVNELQSQNDRIMGKYKTPNDNILSDHAEKAIEKANSNRWLHPNAGPPPEAIALLKQNPDQAHRDYFDKTFGAGASAQVLGGH